MSDASARPRVLCLLGPTAVGKTAVAVQVAQRLHGEIVAADSRQIYAGFVIGSAAPTPEEDAAAPHHLVGFLPAQQAWSVAEFREAAEAAIGDILARGKTPIVVAGTGMYVRALVEGWTLAEVPADPELRERLETEADRDGTPALHARLAQVDPLTAERLSPQDRKRIVRALEVHEKTGRPLSEHHEAHGREPVPFDYRLFGLRRGREDLYARVNARVRAMARAGWLAEVQGLLEQGVDPDAPAMEGLGYRRMAAVLRGEMDLEEAVTLTQRDTRRFAKRQMTWFRAMPGVAWHDLAPEADAGEVAAAIVAAWRSGAA